MTPPTHTVYAIDSADRIIGYDEDWVAFGLENGLADPQRYLGTLLWDGLANAPAELVTLLRALVDCVRVRRARVLGLPYRCDSPTVRRDMELDLEPAPDGGVRFVSRLLASRPRATPVLVPTSPPGPGVLSLCAWCLSAKLERGWCDLTEAVHELGLLALDPLPQVSHGMCPRCAAALRRQIGRASDRGPGPTGPETSDMPHFDRGRPGPPAPG